jgi:hypothetical protein
MRRFNHLDAALDAARCFPCCRGCRGCHIVVFKTGEDVLVPNGMGFLEDRQGVCWHRGIGVRIITERERRPRGLAAELAECYPRGQPRWRVREPPAPPPEFWPLAGDGLNQPLGPWVGG